MQHDSQAWRFYAYVSFGLALTMMLFGVWLIPGALWMKAYFMMGTFFLVGSCFTLSKTLRDEHETKQFSHQLEAAKAEKILKEYEAAA